MASRQAAEEKPAAKQEGGKRAGSVALQPQQSPIASLTSGIKSAYFSIEDKYYSFLDYLEDERKLLVYENFVEPIEMRGVPSMPFAFLICVVAALVLFGLVSLLLAPNTATVTIRLLSDSGGPVSEANVTLHLESSAQGKILASRTSNYDGIATFEKIPLGTELWVTIVAPDYDNYSNSLMAFSNELTTQEVWLSSIAGSQGLRFTLFVRGEDNSPLSNAKIYARHVTGEAVGAGVFTTGATGSVQLPLSKRDFFTVDVEKSGYAPVYGRIIDPARSLASSITLTPNANENIVKMSKVIVTAKNTSSDSVTCEITLSSVAGFELGRRNSIDGQASFDVAQGAQYVVSAKATGVDSAKYYDYSSDVLSASEKINPVDIEFISKTENKTYPNKSIANLSGCGTYSVRVADEESNPIPASVSLYDESKNAFKARKLAQTSTGVVEFDLCTNSSLYATAFLSGYFPGVVRNVKPGAVQQLALRKITSQNTASVEVSVFEPDGVTPSAAAAVALLTLDGGFAGYPMQSTSADGIATISNIESGTRYYAYAEKPPKAANSSAFSASGQSVAKARIVFAYSKAVLVVFPTDIITGKPIDAYVVAKANNMPAKSCKVVVSNSTSCELSVFAQAKVTVEVTATGYESLTSTPFFLSASDKVNYTPSLLPSRLRNEYRVQYSGLSDDSGNAVFGVERGGYYNARFVVNFPANAPTYKSGFIVRIGTVGNENRSVLDDYEHFAIVPPDSVQSPSPMFSYTYAPSGSCSADLRNSENPASIYKWAYYSFDNATGTKEVTVRIFAKPSAYTDEKMRLFFSGWYAATKDGEFIRRPQDLEFGSANRSAALDWCYPSADYRDFYVSAGASSCSSTACVLLSFSDANGTYASKFSGIMGRPFYADVTIDQLRNIQSPRVIAGFSTSLAHLHNYSAVTDRQVINASAGAKNFVEVNLSQFLARATLRFNVTFSDKADYAKFFVDFYNGTSKAASATGYVSATGFGRLKMEYAPEQEYAGSTFDVQALVTDYSSGSAIADGTLWLSDELGTTLGGKQYSALGGSVEDAMQGAGGRYSISQVKPIHTGKFDVVASHPDYISINKSITIFGADFLDLRTLDIDSCGETLPIILANNHSLDAELAVSASKEGCITAAAYAISQNATDFTWVDATSQMVYSSGSYYVALPKGNAGKIMVAPAAWDTACTVTILASARDGSSSTRSVSYSNCKQSAFDDFLSVSPSKIINRASTGTCGKPSSVTLSNTLSVGGNVAVQVAGQGLNMTYSGITYLLDTATTISVPRAGTASLTITPTKKNFTTQLTFTSTDNSRTATVSIPIDNCPEATHDPAPIITASSPTGYAPISTEKVNVAVSTNVYAPCRIGPTDLAAKKLPFAMNYKSGSTLEYAYTLDLSYNKGSGIPFAFQKGRNAVYVGCCNPSSKGGECTASNVQVTFDYTYTAPTATPTPTPKPTATVIPTVTVKPTAIVTPISCTQDNEKSVCGSLNKICVGGKCAEGCRDNSYCESSYTCDQNQKKCVAAACKAEGEAYSPGSPCCSGLIFDPDGLCMKATVCTSNAGCTKPGETCDLDLQVCVPYSFDLKPAEDKRVRFDFSDQQYHKYALDASGNVIAGQIIEGIVLDVSSIMPVAGFVLTLDNSGSIADNHALFGLNGEKTPGVFYINGTAVAGKVLVPPSARVDVIITYPNVQPQFFNENSWGGKAGFSKDVKGNIHFSASSTELAIMGSFSKGDVRLPFKIKPNVIDTDSYFAGMAVFDSTYKQFLPMEWNKEKKYDAYYENPIADEKYELYVFNNNLLMSEASSDPNSGSKFGFSDAEYARSNPTAVPEHLVSSGYQTQPLAINSKELPDVLYKKMRVFPVYSLGSSVRSSRWVEIDRFNLMTQTEAGKSSPIITHDWMQKKINRCLQELVNLKGSLAGKTLNNVKLVDNGDEKRYVVEPILGENVNALGILHLGDGNLFSSDGKKGRLDDIFVSAIEGATMRILWFQYQPGSATALMSYAKPVDITGTYEYPNGANIKIIPNTASAGAVAPIPKELSAYPGQKRNTAYFCAADDAVCPTPVPIYERDKKLVYGPSSTEVKLITLKPGSGSGAAGSCSGSIYTNPASGLQEDNPQRCCPTKMSRNGVCAGSSSNDACFLTQSGEVIYTYSDNKRSIGWFGAPKNPAGATYSCSKTIGTLGSNCYACFNGNNCENDFTTSKPETYSYDCECTTCSDDAGCKTTEFKWLYPQTLYSLKPEGCNALNYNGKSVSNGYTPYALLYPESRCYESQYRYGFVYEEGEVCQVSPCQPKKIRYISNTKCISCSNKADGYSFQGELCPECNGCCLGSPLPCNGKKFSERTMSISYPDQCERQSTLEAKTSIDNMLANSANGVKCEECKQPDD